MKRTFLYVALMAVLIVGVSAQAQAQCAKIQGGTITATNGDVITTGFDKWGYGYQARMFNGLSANFTRPATPATEGPENLVMKWSDDWLANVDCNGDGKLDRGLNAKTGVSDGTSKGWVTNHYEGDYDDAGESYHYTYFVKIVYDGGAACSSGNDACIWGLYMVIEEVYNDPHGGFHGNDRSKLVHPAGLGFYK